MTENKWTYAAGQPVACIGGPLDGDEIVLQYQACEGDFVVFENTKYRLLDDGTAISVDLKEI